MSKTKRLYDSVAWRKARSRYLRSNPLCRLCEAHGDTMPATVVDHIEPHNGDHDLFWDERNWQPLCASCHSGIKRMVDTHGASQACDVNGMPVDKGHAWSDGDDELFP